MDRPAIRTLLDIHALHLAPIDVVGDAVRWQHHPEVARLKVKLEADFRARLERDTPALPERDVVEHMRRLARAELVPPVYDWLADHATRDELTEFIAIEGGPDADFDDLVAVAKVGLTGLPKLTLAANYWDEMGRGTPTAVHTELHHRMVDALGIRPRSVDELPLEALERRALNGYLATNRALQPELLGSLGLIECQAGPRCRRIVHAMERLDVPGGAQPFYDEHASADPRHGKDWVAGSVAPLVTERPDWGPRILRGAHWRALVDHRFFAAMEQRFLPGARRAA
jgi:hypothetical protein